MSELTKPCSVCKEIKHFAEFSPNAKTKSGRASACKECAARKVREYYANNPDVWSEKCRKAKEWIKKNPQKQSEYNRRKYEKVKGDPVKLEKWARSREAKARKAVNNAITLGKLSRLPCMICGEPKSEAHHWSYEPENWLNVQWYCKKHHTELHRQLREQETRPR